MDFTPATITSLLAPFTDPASPLRIEPKGDSFDFSFHRNGLLHDGSLSVSSDGSIEVTTSKGNRVGVATYLASPEITDLDSLASVQEKLYANTDSTPWVTGPALVDNIPYEDSLVALNESTIRLNDKTRVVILDAPAGMGKTTLIERLALAHAKEFTNRQRSSLTLIVSSRGRRLSRLNDAIAATLQDLRSKIVYKEVPVLVRLGLLNLAIDGFDELVNQDGYDDAWGSLGELIDSLQGSGTMILSSRDTFFSEQEFIKRAQRGDEILVSKIDFSFAKLREWKHPQVRDLLEQLKVTESRIQEVIQFFSDSSGLPYGRPVFVRYIANHLLASNSEVDIDSLLPVMIDGFVKRENDVLFQEAKSETSEALLKRFFSELAIEMRNQERDWLEKDVVQFFLDALLEDGGFPEEKRRQLVQRAGSVAFLEQSGDPRKGNRSFPHQVFSDSFYSCGLLAHLKARERAIASLLKLGVFGLDLSDTMVAFIGSDHSLNSLDAIQWVLDLAKEYPELDPVSMNSVAFALTLARASNHVGGGCIQLASATTGTASMGGSEAPHMVVRDSSFALFDLTDTYGVLIDCDESVSIAVLRISQLTRIGKLWKSMPAVLEIVEDSGKTETLRSPYDIQKKINSIRIDTESRLTEPLSEAEKLLEKLARRWMRRFYYDELDVLEEPGFDSPLWPQLKHVLEENGRLDSKVTQTSGRRRVLLHLRNPKGILERRHSDPQEQKEIEKLWQDIKRL